MTKRRIKHEQIDNDGKRNATFRKRMDGLVKKANELSILCGVDVGIVVHQRSQGNTVLWPTPEIFKERLDKFLDFPEIERDKRKVTNEKYMEQTTTLETQDLLKLKNTTELKESQQLLSELTLTGKSVDELHLNELNNLNSFMAHMLEGLRKRENELEAP